LGLDFIGINCYNTYSLEMKYLYIVVLVGLVGCVQKSAPIAIVPPFGESSEVQINPLPHPFNLNGEMPYAVWVNGKKLPLSRKQTHALAKSLNLDFIQPANTEAIHNGEGWLEPLDLEKN
tara:strand:+ start:370 stop:729 length:360 start_codon:yes stop_codon:yes gene_type:complete